MTNEDCYLHCNIAITRDNRGELLMKNDTILINFTSQTEEACIAMRKKQQQTILKSVCSNFHTCETFAKGQQ